MLRRMNESDRGCVIVRRDETLQLKRYMGSWDVHRKLPGFVSSHQNMGKVDIDLAVNRGRNPENRTRIEIMTPENHASDLQCLVSSHQDSSKFTTVYVGSSHGTTP